MTTSGFGKNLKLWHKLSGVVGLLVVPIGMLAWLLVAEKNLAIDFAAKEVSGVEYLGPVRAVLADAAGGMAGRATTPDKSLATLAATDGASGAALQTAEAYGAVVAAAEASQADDGKAQAAFMESLVALVARVGDTSNLILDPDLDSFYLMDVIVVRLAPLAKEIAAHAADAVRLAGAGALTQDDRITLVARHGRIEGMLSDTARSLGVAFENNAALEPRLGAVGKALAQAGGDFLATVRTALIEPETPLGDAAKLQGAAQAALGSVFSVHDAVAPALTGLLENRIAGFESGKWNALAAVSVCVLLALGFAAWMVRIVSGSVVQATAVAARIASGDLTGTVCVTGTDETAILLQTLDRMQANLATRVAQVRQNAETIATGSSEIAAGNRNLSQRTESQAASLEETASSMEELTGTVKNNAANAQQANQLAVGARELATRGGEVVDKAVSAMKAIQSSSERIAEIIGVIDDIAFQTNLLALNASVEAARAGEQGRGFAVVATEVRSLAQRSATAAKEIKDLIHDSVEKVRAGSGLVDASGKTLVEIVGSVKKVVDIVQEIAAASAEQSLGIGQVNSAVTQMDEVTQQNAALAEEAAAASTAMRDQATSMARLMEFFQITAVTGTQGRATPTPRAKVTPAPSGTVRAAPKPAARPMPAPAPAAPVMSAKPPAKDEGDEWAEF